MMVKVIYNSYNVYNSYNEVFNSTIHIGDEFEAISDSGGILRIVVDESFLKVFEDRRLVSFQYFMKEYCNMSKEEYALLGSSVAGIRTAGVDSPIYGNAESAKLWFFAVLKAMGFSKKDLTKKEKKVAISIGDKKLKEMRMWVLGIEKAKKRREMLIKELKDINENLELPPTDLDYF